MMSKAVNSGTALVGPTEPCGVFTGTRCSAGGAGGGAVCSTFEGGVETVGAGEAAADAEVLAGTTGMTGMTGMAEGADCAHTVCVKAKAVSKSQKSTQRKRL